jgi:hypothetical protein
VSNTGSSVSSHNSALGYFSGYMITTGKYNTALGSWTIGNSGGSVLTGDGNTCVGYKAGFDLTGDADENTIVGYLAGENVTSSDGNTLVGGTAGDVITTGGSNVCIGAGSDPSANDGQNQIVIGTTATGQGDNYAVIGNASVTRLYAAQDGAAVLYADATINSSDKRLKENIEDSDLGLEFVNKLRPVRYNYIKDKQDGKTKYGIIAQEVQEVLKESNNEDFAGIKDSDEYLGADYVQFVAPLIKAVQELSAEVKSLKQQLEDK